ncbi:hypothetical protein HUU42_00790 [bacterium]|nr:hypothetical protein [bacterium]
MLSATIGNIVTFPTKEFGKLVLMSNFIAWPLTYWLMNQWLENFAYRIDVGVASFLLSSAVALAIALITMSYQAIKAATANPVER